MKIVFVTSFLGIDYGGAEVSTKLLMAKLIDKGHDIYALTTRKVQGKSERIIPVPYSNQIPKKMLTLGNSLIDRFLARNLKKKIEELNPDLLHVQDTYILPASVLADRKLGIPMVATVRNNVLDWVYDLIFSFPFSTFLKKRNKVILRCLEEVDAIISVSQYIKRELVSRGINAKKIVPIYNLYPMFNVDRYNPAEERYSKIRLFAPGFLSRYKGFFALIHAMKNITEKEEKVKLVIAGDGPERKNLERLTERLRLKKFVDFIGKVPHERIAELYLNSNIVVFPSIHPEAFGRVALEAMTFGKPVIASRVGGIPEIVKDGETGLLVPPDDGEELAKAIMTLVENEELRESMGKMGEEVTHQEFNPEKIVEQHLKVYNLVTQAKN